MSVQLFEITVLSSFAQTSERIASDIKVVMGLKSIARDPLAIEGLDILLDSLKWSKVQQDAALLMCRSNFENIPDELKQA